MKAGFRIGVVIRRHFSGRKNTGRTINMLDRLRMRSRCAPMQFVEVELLTFRKVSQKYIGIFSIMRDDVSNRLILRKDEASSCRLNLPIFNINDFEFQMHFFAAR